MPLLLRIIGNNIKELQIGDRVITSNGEQGYITSFQIEQSDILALVRITNGYQHEDRKYPLRSVKKLGE